MPSVESPYRTLSSYVPVLVQAAILATVGWVGLHTGPGRILSRTQAWLLIMLLLAGFAVVAGHGITGYWRGILIDARFRLSLSRLQLLAWMLVVLSAIVTAALTNDAYGSQTALSISVPPELWLLLGISTASAIAAPAILSTKRSKTPDPGELEKTTTQLRKDAQVEVDESRSGVVLYNQSPVYARWGDILKGDESGNASTVDLGKLQMFFFTFVLVLGYATAIVKLFDGANAVGALPPIDNSLNTLLGISQTGYLANKAVPHSREA